MYSNEPVRSEKIPTTIPSRGLVESPRNRLSVRAAERPEACRRSVAEDLGVKSMQIAPFNTQAVLDSTGIDKKIVEYRRADVIFAQGDPSQHVLYLQQGNVKLSVLSKTGREAVVALLRAGEFFGEGCLAGEPLRRGTATAMTDSTIVLVDKKEMGTALRQQNALSAQFMAHMLARNIRIEEDLVDQLFNSTEKRLARALVLLARSSQHNNPSQAVPPVSQELLARIIGTTRSRVNFFMKKFQRLGFIDYSDGLKVSSRLNAFLQD